MAARKKKASAKKTVAKASKAPRKVKFKKAAAPKRKTSRKAKKAVAPKRKARKTKRKAKAQKTTTKNILKNVQKLQKLSMADVKKYIANVDVIDKLEELLLALEQQIARRLEKQKIIKKIT